MSTIQTLSLVAASVVSLAVAGPIAASAASNPAISLTTETYTGSRPGCKMTVQRARISGVPADVETRIDGILDKTLTDNVPKGASLAAAWSADCSRSAHDYDSYGKSTGEPFVDTLGADWTKGYIHGRWVSVRFHVTTFAGGAHPSDDYISLTFDLDHGGYPVPKAGFYTKSHRADIDRLIGDGMVADNKTYGNGGETDQQARDAAQQVDLDSSGILLTKTGIQITNYYDFEAGRNAMLDVPFSKLDALGTPGGPLDPTTR